jgi:SdrD B-like domain/Bacterial Ig domain
MSPKLTINSNNVVKMFTYFLSFILVASITVNSIPAIAAGSLTKSAKDAVTSSTTTTTQNGTVDYTLNYQNTGTTIDSVNFEDILGTNQSLVAGSLQVPTGFNKQFSTNAGISYTTTEPGSGVNAVKSTGNVGVSGGGVDVGDIDKPLGGFNIGASGGDGWRPIIYHSPDGTVDKICAIFHHTLDANINCVNLDTGLQIAGFPKRLNPSQAIFTPSQMGRNSVQIGSKVWVMVTGGPNGSPANNDSGVQCFDMGTDSSCGYTAIGPAIPMNTSNYEREDPGALTAVNGKYYYSVFNKLYCVDLPATTACAGYTPYTFAPSAANGTFQSNIVIGNKIFLKGGLAADRSISCVDLSNPIVPTTCTGSWPKIGSANAAGGSLSEYLNTSGTILGICSHIAPSYNNFSPALSTGYCYDLAGNSVTAPAGLMSEIALSSFKLGTKMFIHGQTDYTYCYDYATAATCTGFIDSGAGATVGKRRWDQPNVGGLTGGVVTANAQTYSFEYDNGCLYAAGNSGFMWSFDPASGSTPCSKVYAKQDIATTSFATTACDGTVIPSVTAWDKIAPIGGVYPVGWQSTLATIYSDANYTTIIPGYNNVLVPSTGLNISGISYATYPNIYVKYENNGLIATPIQMAVSYTPGQSTYKVCFKAKVANTCFLPAITNTSSVRSTPLPVTGSSVYTTNTSNTTSMSVTSSSTCYGTVSGKVFADTNADGISTGDPGLSGITCTLYDSSNNVVATMPSGALGTYSFANVLPGSGYYVGFSGIPNSKGISPVLQGGNTAIDSDVIPATSKTAPFSIVANTPVANLDLGLFAYNAVDDTYQTPINTPITYDPKTNDVISSGSTITKINGVTPVVGTPIPVPNGTATLTATGTITFTPNTGYVGSSSFPYTVTTPGGFSTTAIDTITIVSSSDDTGETAINTPITYNPVLNDSVPTGSTITKINGVTPVVGTPITIPNGTVTLLANGTITVSPNTGYTGTLNFPYTVTTALGVSVTSNDTIYVVGATDDVRDTLVNTPITYSPTSNDSVPVGSTITKINGITPVVGTPITIPNGTVTLNSDGTVTATPATGYVGTLTFPYQVTTPSSTIVSANDIIFINKVADDAKETPFNTPITYSPLTNDTVPAGSVMTQINGVNAVVGTPIPITNGSVVLNSDGTITATPTTGFIGTLSFPYTITTPTGTPLTANDTILIVKLIDDTKTTPVNTPITYDPKTNDSIPTGSTITKINGITPVVGTPITIPNGSVTLTAAGTFTVTPNTNYTGALTFPYTISTPTGTIVTANNTINILNTNPVAVDETYNTLIDTPVTLNPLNGDTDLDPGAILAITSLNGTTLTPGTAQTISVTNGTVTVSSTGVITFTPAAGYTGSVSFPYVISDGQGGTATAIETITINRKVLANNDTRTASGSITYNPLTDDTNILPGSRLTKINGKAFTTGVPITIDGGTVVVNTDGTVTVTPFANGTVRFGYTVVGPDGQEASAVSEVVFSGLSLIRTGGQALSENRVALALISLIAGMLLVGYTINRTKKINK